MGTVRRIEAAVMLGDERLRFGDEEGSSPLEGGGT